MLDSSEILARLAATAAGEVRVAIGWHVALLIGALALIGGWRPSQRAAARLVALLPASAAAVAAFHGNPFNGGLLGAVAVTLVVLAQWSPKERVTAAPLVAFVPGALLLAAGVLYPEFVSGSPLRVVFAAPVGVLPCPSLYAAVGLAMMGSVGRRAWADVLAAAALFYGVFGVARLGVALDVGLIAGALGLVALRLLYRAPHAAPRRSRP